MTVAIEATVALCIHKRTSHLAEVFEALTKQRHPPGFEVLLVLNATTPEVAAFVRELSARHRLKVRLVEASAIGLSHARNRAIDECRTRWLIFLDDDAVPAPDWLSALVREAKAHRARVLGGRTILRWDFPRPDWFDERYDKFLSCIDLGDDTFPVTTGHVLVGANLLYDMSVFARGLRFDARLGRIGDDLLSNEELALNRELTRQGVISYYTGRARVDHIVDPNRVTPEWLAERIFAQGRSWRIHHALELDSDALAKELNRHVKEFAAHVQDFSRYREDQWRGWIECAAYAGYLIEHARQSGIIDTRQGGIDGATNAGANRRLFEDAVDAYEAGIFERARQLFAKLSEDAEYGGRAWLHLGDIALASQQWRAAASCYRQSLKIQPSRNPATERVPTLFQRWAEHVPDRRRQRILRRKALDLLRQRRRPPALQRYQRASLERTLGYLDSARTTFESLARHGDLGAGASFHLGEIALASGEWRQAARWYRRCLKRQPAHQMAATRLESLSTEKRQGGRAADSASQRFVQIQA
jgi:glucosyl-dolichyl phosphate glucuronosyltransferase